MKLSYSEAQDQLNLAKSLPKTQREKLVATIKAADIYEVDDKGIEKSIKLEIVTPEEAAVEDKETDLVDTITKAVKAEVEEIRKSVETRKVSFEAQPQGFIIPKTVRRRSPKNFADYSGQTKSAMERAYGFGMWAIAACTGNRKAVAFCESNGIELKRVHSDGEEDGFTKATPQSEGVNIYGGYLVPIEYDNDLIVLREQYGVFRKNARLVTMLSDTKQRRRRTGGLTASFVGEGNAGTPSKKTWDVVNLTAKKIMALTTMSNELNADAAISLGDDLAGEIGYAFANKEDDCGFNGDGTSTYGGIVGVRSKLTNVNGTDDGGGLVLQGTSNTWSAIVLGDFNKLIGALPQFADTANAGFYCHRTFWASVMQKLQAAAGGNTIDTLRGGARVPEFLGYPVVLSQIMPSSTAVATVPVIFGDLSLAADYGDRTDTAISFSDSATVDGVSVFETDEIAVRGTERFDINVHDVGTSTVAGPVVGLVTGP